MADLFEGCSDDEVTLKTDNSYAKRYDEWRRKEELMKAKARFGSDLEDSSSSDEEEDDEARSDFQHPSMLYPFHPKTMGYLSNDVHSINMLFFRPSVSGLRNTRRSS